MSLDQAVMTSFADLVPIPPIDGKADIQLRHLLTMTSGLSCGRTPGEPELYAMLASDNYVEYALDLPLAMPPGTEFAYCSPGSHLMSAMVGKATGMSAFDFARETLFGPLGIEEAVWPADPQGVSHGWGDLQLHPRDMAKIGQLFLSQGAWNGTHLVSEDWVDQATQSHAIADVDGTGYGYQWWVLTGAFDGVYEARGRGGQAIVVWPEKDVVAVFTAHGDPPLPPMAAQASGKVYRFAANQFDVQCITLRFASPSEVWFSLILGSGSFDLPVGMDGVPRFSETGPTAIPIGVLGAWTEPTVFSMQYDEVSGPNHLRIRGDFGDSADDVELEFTDPGEYFPPQTIQGSVVETCN